MKLLPYDKVCGVEDFSSDDLAEIMRDVRDPEGRRCGAAFTRAGAGA